MTKSFYKLENSLDQKSIGLDFPQIQQVGGGIDMDSSNSIFKVGNSIPDFEPELDYFLLEDSAIVTDFLSASQISNGYLLSNRVKEIFEGFTSTRVAYFPAKILYKGNKLTEYFWAIWDGDIESIVSFEKSVFFATDFFGNKVSEIEVKSAKEYNNIRGILRSKRQKLSLEKLALNSMGDVPDIFKLQGIYSDIFISEEVKEALVGNGVTGINLSVAF